MVHDTPSEHAHAPARVGPYVLRERLGAGSSAEVWAADLGDGSADLAVKRFSRETLGEEDSVRARRELAILGMLRLPGVARLLDQGVHDGQRYVVMERVHGHPFPGSRRSPLQVMAAARDLLETLGEVHRRGIVHRDIKPDNVLVTAEGRVVVLDFGLARGGANDGTVTRTGTFVGTPRYLAPEQLLGQRVGPAADLYAVGVMLFEALEGHPPHDATDLATLWRERLTRPAPELRRTDGPLGELIARLLRRDVEARPASAAEALAILGTASAVRALPWLGPTEDIDHAVERLLDGQTVVVGGGPGMGRTRLVREVISRVTSASRAVCALEPSSSPFGSVPTPVTGEVSGATGAREAVSSWLVALAEEGTVLVADTLDRLDPWTRALLDTCDGPRLLVDDDQPDVLLGPLTEADLRPLFHGPDRVWHLREDAARELWRRTRGIPARVVAVLDAWVRAGDATWRPPKPLRFSSRPSDGVERLAVSRETLDRLAAGDGTGGVVQWARRARDSEEVESHLEWTAWIGPGATVGVVAAVSGDEAWRVALIRDALVQRGWIEVSELGVQVTTTVLGGGTWSDPAALHRRTAPALAPGTPGRLDHLLRGETLDGVTEEALALARSWAESGRKGMALGVLTRLGRALPDAVTGNDGDAITSLAVQLALSLGTEDALDEAEALLQRVDAAEELVELLAACREGRSGNAEEALGRLGALGFEDDEALELVREAECVTAAARVGVSTLERVVEEAAARWAGREEDRIRSKVLTWRGVVAGERRDHRLAADLHTRAAVLRVGKPEQLSSLYNASRAWRWAGEQQAADRDASTLLHEATERRHCAYIARAERCLREGVHRRGGTEPDLELAEACSDDVGVLLTEAIIACRGGHPAGLALVEQAEELAQVELPVVTGLLVAMRAYLGGTPRGTAVPTPGTPSMQIDIEILTGVRQRPPAPDSYKGVFI